MPSENDVMSDAMISWTKSFSWGSGKQGFRLVRLQALSCNMANYWILNAFPDFIIIDTESAVCKILCIQDLPYHYNILPKLPQWVDFSSKAIAHNRKNYDCIEWKPETADIVINHWLNHLEHPDTEAFCRTTCTCQNTGLATRS